MQTRPEGRVEVTDDHTTLPEFVRKKVGTQVWIYRHLDAGITEVVQQVQSTYYSSGILNGTNGWEQLSARNRRHAVTQAYNESSVKPPQFTRASPETSPDSYKTIVAKAKIAKEKREWEEAGTREEYQRMKKKSKKVSKQSQASSHSIIPDTPDPRNKGKKSEKSQRRLEREQRSRVRKTKFRDRELAESNPYDFVKSPQLRQVVDQYTTGQGDLTPKQVKNGMRLVNHLRTFRGDAQFFADFDSLSSVFIFLEDIYSCYILYQHDTVAFAVHVAAVGTRYAKYIAANGWKHLIDFFSSVFSRIFADTCSIDLSDAVNKFHGEAQFGEGTVETLRGCTEAISSFLSVLVELLTESTGIITKFGSSILTNLSIIGSKIKNVETLGRWLRSIFLYIRRLINKYIFGIVDPVEAAQANIEIAFEALSDSTDEQFIETYLRVMQSLNTLPRAQAEEVRGKILQHTARYISIIASKPAQDMDPDVLSSIEETIKLVDSMHPEDVTAHLLETLKKTKLTFPPSFSSHKTYLNLVAVISKVSTAHLDKEARKQRGATMLQDLAQKVNTIRSNYVDQLTMDECVTLKSFRMQYHLADFYLDPAERASVAMAYKFVEEHKTQYNNVLSVSHFRQAPKVIWISGPAGTGKTTFLNTLIQQWGRKFAPDLGGNLVFNYNPDDDYFDGYTDQPIFLISDAFNSNSADLNVKTGQFLIHLIDTAPMPLNMAHLDAKGSKFAKPKLVIVSSNPTVESIPNLAVIIDKNAFIRRIPNEIRFVASKSTSKKPTIGNHVDLSWWKESGISCLHNGTKKEVAHLMVELLKSFEDDTTYHFDKVNEQLDALRQYSKSNPPRVDEDGASSSSSWKPLDDDEGCDYSVDSVDTEDEEEPEFTAQMPSFAHFATSPLSLILLKFMVPSDFAWATVLYVAFGSWMWWFGVGLSIFSVIGLATSRAYEFQGRMKRRVSALMLVAAGGLMYTGWRILSKDREANGTKLVDSEQTKSEAQSPMRQAVVRPARVPVVPKTFAGSAQMPDAKNIRSHAIILYEGMPFNAIGISGRTLLTFGHMRYCFEVIGVKQFSLLIGGQSFDVSDYELVPIEGFDLCLVKIKTFNVPEFPNIVNKFLTEEQVNSNWFAGNIFLQRVVGSNAMFHHLNQFRKYDTSTYQASFIHDGKTHTRMIEPTNSLYGGVLNTVRGDCGFMYVVDWNQPQCYLGLHTAGDVKAGLACFHIITQEMLKEWIEIYKPPIQRTLVDNEYVEVQEFEGEGQMCLYPEYSVSHGHYMNSKSPYYASGMEGVFVNEFGEMEKSMTCPTRGDVYEGSAGVKFATKKFQTGMARRTDVLIPKEWFVAFNTFLCSLMPAPNAVMQCIQSIATAINGISVLGIKAIPKSTAVGWPWNKIWKVSKKGQTMHYNGDGTYTAKEYLVQVVMEQLDALRTEPSKYINVNTLNIKMDELLQIIGELLDGSPEPKDARILCAESLVNYIIGRILLLHISDAIRRLPFVAIMLDSGGPAFDRFFRTFSARVSRILMGDMKFYDTTCASGFWMDGFYALSKEYTSIHYPDRLDEWDSYAKSYLMCMGSSHAIYGNALYYLQGILITGHCMTVEWNCYRTIFMIFASYCYGPSDIPRGPREFNDDLSVIVLGDDFVVGLREGSVRLTMHQLQKFFLDVFDVILTDPFKKSDFPDDYPIEDFNFMCRNVRFDHGKYVGILERESLYGRIFWLSHKAGPFEAALIANCESVQRDVMLQGKDFFDAVGRRLSAAASRLNVRFIPLTFEVEVRAWSKRM